MRRIREADLEASSEEKLAELWRRFKEKGDREARDALIVHYAPLVKYVASRVMSGMPRSVDPNDIVSYGIMGLIDAVERFDLGKHVKFETYALSRIKGAIIDELRSIDWVPRSVRVKIRQLEQATEKLEKVLGRSPTSEELAGELGITTEQLQQIFKRAQTAGMLALDDTVGWMEHGENIRLLDTLADDGSAPPAAVEHQETLAELKRALSKLPERERLVVTLYYFEGLPLSQVGKALGVTESRACQLHSQAVLHLRDLLGDDGGSDLQSRSA